VWHEVEGGGGIFVRKKIDPLKKEGFFNREGAAGGGGVSEEKHGIEQCLKLTGTQ